MKTATDEAIEVLVETPDDTQANLALEKHLCFAKLDWDNGLPIRCSVGDHPIGILARDDSAGPLDSEGRLKLAD